MRRLVSVLAGSILLTLGATSAFAEQISTISEQGIPISLAQLDYRYQSAITSANPDNYVVSTGHRVEIYKFQAQRGQCVDLVARSDDFDAFLGIYQRDATGTLIKLVEDDDTGGGRAGLDARIRTTLYNGGTYYAVVSESDHGSGRYSLDLATCGASSASQPAATPFARF